MRSFPPRNPRRALRRETRPARRLQFEPLEARHLLAASPWQNPAHPLDVDGDRFISGTDALLIVNRLNSGLDTRLPTLGPGETPDFYYDTNGDGFATAGDVLLIADRLNADTPPPSLSVALANDTAPAGIANDDGITADPALAGIVTVEPPLADLWMRLNDDPAEHSVRGFVQGQGSFLLTRAQLEAAWGAPLPDGDHVVHWRAINDLGLETTRQVAFRLDTTIEAPAQPDLPALSDTGASDVDNLTRIAAPPIAVAAEPGSTVTLFVDGQPLLTAVASPEASFTLPALAEGTYQLTARSVDVAGNVSPLSAPLELRIQTAVPVVTMLAVPYQDDLTPRVHVSVTDAAHLPDGTPIYLDIDRNYDHDYNDEDENATAAATVIDGKAVLQVSVPLADPGPDATSPIRLRVRVVDEAGNIGVDERTQWVDRRTSSALVEYLAADDAFFTFDSPQEILPRQAGYRAYFTELTSQVWRSAAEVDQPLWRHWLTIVVPDVVNSSTAILNITGNDRTDAEPNYVDVPTWLLALASNSVVVELSQVPNKPLTFSDESAELRENGTIAYTFDKFLEDPTDTSWPVLAAMVKGAVRGMDAAQTLAASGALDALPPEYRIDDFVVTGAANQGWVTWLMPAVDARVKAIVPALFDSLNQDEQSIYQFAAYGFFPEELSDYAERNLFERTLTAAGAQLGAIVDPYHYFPQGGYDIPKFALLAPGDEFFVPDATQGYFDDLPGTQNYLRFVPNTGHYLDLEGLFSIAVVARALVNELPLPEYSWEILADGSIRVVTSDGPSAVKLWQATNPTARDFRQAHTGAVWTSSTLVDQGGGIYLGDVATPATGATAFFVELTFPSGAVLPPGPEIPYKFTSAVSVRTALPWHAWPFPLAPELTAEPLEQLIDRHLIDGAALEGLRSAAIAAQVAPTTTADPGAVLAAAALAAAFERESEAIAKAPSRRPS